MAFITYMYDAFLKPENVTKDRNTKYAMYIYLVAMFCFSLSVKLISNNRTSVVSILFLFFSMVLCFAISIIINVSILHLIISLFYKYKPRHSLRTFLTDVFLIHKVFIMLLPLSLILSIFPIVFYRVCFVLFFVLLYVYYIYSFSQVINTNVKLESKSQALFLLVVLYVILNVVSFVFKVSNILVLVNILLSFTS